MWRSTRRACRILATTSANPLSTSAAAGGAVRVAAVSSSNTSASPSQNSNCSGVASKTLLGLGGTLHGTSHQRGFASSSSGSGSGGSGCSSRGPCWSCSAPTTLNDHFFCSGCNAILPAAEDAADSSRDYFFALLAVHPPRFEVNLGQLEASMKGLQKTLHPDKFSTVGGLHSCVYSCVYSCVNSADP